MPCIDIYLVIVDNGDIEPELWAFHNGTQAEEFAALRGGDIHDVTVMDRQAAQTLIDEEEVEPH
jgi:hypothetical protein